MNNTACIVLKYNTNSQNCIGIGPLFKVSDTNTRAILNCSMYDNVKKMKTLRQNRIYCILNIFCFQIKRELISVLPNSCIFSHSSGFLCCLVDGPTSFPSSWHILPSLSKPLMFFLLWSSQLQCLPHSSLWKGHPAFWKRQCWQHQSGYCKLYQVGDDLMAQFNSCSSCLK